MNRHPDARCPDDLWPHDLRPESCPVFAHNERFVAAPAGRVWEELIRAPEWPGWYPNARRVRLDGDATVLSAGTRFRWITFGVPVDCRVEVHDPPRHLAWRGTGLGAEGWHLWWLEPREGGCRVTTEEVQRGLVPRLLRPLLVRGLLHFHQLWLDRLAARVEGEG